MLRIIKLSELIASGFIPSPERDRWCRVWVDLGRQAKLGKILTTQNTASQFFRPTVFYVVRTNRGPIGDRPRLFPIIRFDYLYWKSWSVPYCLCPLLSYCLLSAHK